MGPITTKQPEIQEANIFVLREIQWTSHFQVKLGILWLFVVHVIKLW